MAETNPHAERNRDLKVAKLVRVLDAALVRDEVNPLSWEAVHRVEDLTPLGRAGFEMLAGVNRGSDRTWAAVREFYRSRRAVETNRAQVTP